jgi:hypothetical protein
MIATVRLKPDATDDRDRRLKPHATDDQEPSD